MTTEKKNVQDAWRAYLILGIVIVIIVAGVVCGTLLRQRISDDVQQAYNSGFKSGYEFEYNSIQAYNISEYVNSTPMCEPNYKIIPCHNGTILYEEFNNVSPNVPLSIIPGPHFGLSSSISTYSLPSSIVIGYNYSAIKSVLPGNSVNSTSANISD